MNSSIYQQQCERQLLAAFQSRPVQRRCECDPVRRRVRCVSQLARRLVYWHQNKPMKQQQQLVAAVVELLNYLRQRSERI